MMGPGETIAAVVLGGIVISVLILLGTVFKRFMAYKERQLGFTADATAEKAAQYASHVEQVKDRLGNVERIVTDSGYRLGHEIESLREDKGKVQ